MAHIRQNLIVSCHRTFSTRRIQAHPKRNPNSPHTNAVKDGATTRMNTRPRRGGHTYNLDVRQHGEHGDKLSLEPSDASELQSLHELLYALADDDKHVENKDATTSGQTNLHSCLSRWRKINLARSVSSSAGQVQTCDVRACFRVHGALLQRRLQLGTDGKRLASARIIGPERRKR